MRVIIAGGGTGGHLFPGVAVAREFLRRSASSTVLFVGAEQGIEARLIPKEGFPLRTLPVGGIKGVGGWKRIRNLVAMVKAVRTAGRIRREFNPDVVIGVGGYASFPMLAAAQLGRCPTLIMEQNAVPGLANRVLGRWADAAAVTSPATAARFPRAVVTGNPVRPEFNSVPMKPHVEPFVALVFGGSQGAQSINSAIAGALDRLGAWRGRLRFVHQAGTAQVEEVRAAYRSAGFDAEVQGFFDAFHQRYAEADLIVARAGATTIAELKAAGRASLLVPFPFAADDHQTRNAMEMAAAGAARWIDNGSLNGDWLAAQFDELFSQPARLTEMELKARALAIPDAEARIVDMAERIVRERAPHHV